MIYPTIPAAQFLTRNKLSCSKISYFHNFCLCSGRHHTDRCTLFHSSFLDPAEYDNTLIGIIHGIKDQCLQRCLRISVRCRYLLPRSAPAPPLHSVRSLQKSAVHPVPQYRSHPQSRSITRSGSALGRSILLITGITSRS